VLSVVVPKINLPLKAVVTVDELTEMVSKYVTRYKTNKVVLQGGDPLTDININFTKEFVATNRYKFDICIFTGHSIDKAKEYEIEGFKFIKTGKYDITYGSGREFYGVKLATANQRIFKIL
jgi:organic radical activating enzyme